MREDVRENECKCTTEEKSEGERTSLGLTGAAAVSQQESPQREDWRK